MKMSSFCFQTVGGYSGQPGRSCKHILDSGGSRGDGEYWIDPERTGNPLKVFCDMTTDGGMLWMVIAMIMSKSYCICRNAVKGTAGPNCSLLGTRSFHCQAREEMFLRARLTLLFYLVVL